ncbi:MAG: hypothetical protein EOP05_14840 [Proteobacteria bacterium]|nr:MAG: hypothetical protein EOP05_14840 [Pseudomonadota bacterium]
MINLRSKAVGSNYAKKRENKKRFRGQASCEHTSRPCGIEQFWELERIQERESRTG